MTHHVTANKYYHLDKKLKQKVKVGRYLEKIKEDDGETETPTTTTSSAGTRLILTKKETETLNQATAHLPNNAKRADILHAININPEAIKDGLTVSAGHFTAQQLRD